MKDFNKRQIEQEMIKSDLDKNDILEQIDFCLKRLYQDKKHFMVDEFVRGLSFEELIGALLDTKIFIKNI